MKQRMTFWVSQRICFPPFRKRFGRSFLTGENYPRFHVVPGNLCSVKEYVAFGRILEHGFDLVGFVPNFLNQSPVLFYHDRGYAINRPYSKRILRVSGCE